MVPAYFANRSDADINTELQRFASQRQRPFGEAFCKDMLPQMLYTLCPLAAIPLVMYM